MEHSHYTRERNRYILMIANILHSPMKRAPYVHKKQALIIILTLMVAFGAEAQLHKVPEDYPTIQSAINASAEGDTVLVAEGTYYENIDFLGKSITVASPFLVDRDTAHISRTIIDGSQYTDSLHASVVTLSGGKNNGPVLSGFTLTGGAGTNYPDSKQFQGGGIYIFGNGALIEYNRITGNIIEKSHCGSGGIAAFLNEDDTLIIRHNDITDNHIITDHMTASGGITLVSAKHALMEVHDNTISLNTVYTSAVYKAVGGGVYLQADYGDHAAVRFYNNVVSRNELHCQSSFGGGLYIVYSRITSDPLTDVQVRIYNNLIADNYSEDKGGGIAIWNTEYSDIGSSTPLDPVVVNNTITGNISSDGAGLFNYDAQTLCYNNILWDSLTTPECRDIFNSDIVGYCLPESPRWCKNKNNGALFAVYNNVRGGWSGTGNLAVDPQFEPGSYRLAEGSRCIGGGTDSLQYSWKWHTAPESDFYGSRRPALTGDGKVDLGAIESSYEANVYIPDTAFLHALIREGVDMDGDSLISYPEAESVEVLDVGVDDLESFGKITDLTGLSAFKNLDSLNISNHQISHIDVSALSGLKSLVAYRNQISSIDITENPDLAILDLGFNNLLSSLDLSNNPALEVLSCSDNFPLFVDVDVSHNPLLRDLDVSNNVFSHIDVSHNPDLQRLNVRENIIDVLDLSSNADLQTLNCSGNSLTGLDLSFQPGLEILNCTGNMISELDLTQLHRLKSLHCGVNKFTRLDLRNNNSIIDLSLVHSPDLLCVSVWEGFPEGVNLDTIDSPALVFTTEDCSVGLEHVKPTYFSVYPNPIKGAFNIEFDHADRYNIEVDDLNGKHIDDWSVSGSTQSLDLSFLPKGIYLITVRSAREVATEKIIKL